MILVLAGWWVSLSLSLSLRLTQVGMIYSLLACFGCSPSKEGNCEIDMGGGERASKL
ncbi:hypothetical protein Scep_017395 [Stephania cephalantha]|uniref:Uncharacterized protein n=1 Tax=Stephania cephalantha TaxID=152367 RepID=A0AAP0NTI3_9MAGN